MSSNNQESLGNSEQITPALPQHSAAKRQSRRKESYPDNFEERAKANAMQVSKIHEFRRQNIREFEDPKKDYFEYDPTEKRRYDALKIESLFKLQTTYKAIKWGIVVGTMFAFHRYYRTRDINNAAHWFTVMSFVSFFNIWASYGLQEFVTEYGSRKSLSLAARNEYHTNAYKNYIETLEQQVKPLDDKVRPILHNSQAIALNEFIENYDNYLLERFGTENLDKDQIEQQLREQAKINPESLTTNQIGQIQMMKKDQYQREIQKQALDTNYMKEFTNNIRERIEQVDLKSYDFNKDPDLTYKFS